MFYVLFLMFSVLHISCYTIVLYFGGFAIICNLKIVSLSGNRFFTLFTLLSLLLLYITHKTITSCLCTMSYFLDTSIVPKGVPASPFLRYPPLDPACPSFLKSLCPLPSVLLHLLLRYFRQFPLPSCKSLLP